MVVVCAQCRDGAAHQKPCDRGCFCTRNCDAACLWSVSSVQPVLLHHIRSVSCTNYCRYNTRNNVTVSCSLSPKCVWSLSWYPENIWLVDWLHSVCVLKPKIFLPSDLTSPLAIATAHLQDNHPECSEPCASAKRDKKDNLEGFWGNSKLKRNPPIVWNQADKQWDPCY